MASNASFEQQKRHSYVRYLLPKPGELAGRVARYLSFLRFALVGDEEIEQDRSLGPQYRIGHSYVTPAAGHAIGDARKWFGDVVETEIVPLLEEYWFDAPEKVAAARQQLLEGL